jgi:cysteine-rich repeat protein
MRSHQFRRMVLVFVCSSGAGCLAVSGCGGGDSSLTSPVKDAGIDSSPDGGDTDGGESCGNAIVEGFEECDDANGMNGDGCESDCSFSCVAGEPVRDNCDDDNPCNGEETCGSEHYCTPGVPLDDGEACGEDLVCVGGNCEPASCGDAQLQSPEECDDGNVTASDGCESDCKYSCLSTDTTRDCSGGDECAGQSTCDDASHTCSTPTPVADDTPCDAGNGYCLAGVCIAPQCGNGDLELGELCDDGNTDDDDGCKQDCTYTCTDASACDDGSSCTQDVCDTTAHTCSNPVDAGQDNQACSEGGVTGTCQSGVCTPAGCGDGNVDAGEECDNGPGNNGPGTGCTTGCQFECDTSADCTDSNACNGTETCATVAGGKTCQSGTALSEGDECQASPRRICDASGVCVLSLCGDDYIDTGAGETCEPPSTATCDATCHTIVPNVCGDGSIGGTEQCDDGATSNLDGCDAGCGYELFMRMNSVTIERGQAPSWCDTTANALGGALSGLAQDSMNTSLEEGVTDGTTNIIMQMLELDDLTGVADNAFEIGITSGAPDPAAGAWPGNDPMDWSFLLAPSTLDANGVPLHRFANGTLAARAFQAGPSDVPLTIVFGTSPAVLQILDGNVRGRFATGTSVPAPPPSQLAAGLQVVDSLNANGATEGLCGNVTVESLARIPVPEELTTGTNACRSQCSNSESYTYCGENQPVGPGCNSLLDVFVGGCRASIFCITAISRTQPDVSNGGPSPLTLGTNNKVPTSQTDGNQNAYSSWFRFTMNRQHATGTQ